MSLFEKLKNKRSSLQEKKDDGIKKPTKKANKEVFDVTGKSAVRDAKKYASGEYPKIGGGQRIGSKSKGPGAETGAKVNLNPTSGSKSKGTTPVKVNITKPVKQSEVSKKAKEFSQNLKKIKGTKTGKPISTGDIGFTAPDRKTKVTKRTTRAIKQGTPDPFKSKTKFSQKGFEKSLKKFSKGPRTGIDNPFMKSPAGDRFKIGDTKGEMNVKAMNRKAFKKTQPKDVQLPKSFTDFSKKLKTLKTDVAKTASAAPRIVTKKYKTSTPKTPSQPETGFGGTPGSQPVGGTSGSSTKTVKQSEVSKQAKDFTQKINNKKLKNTKVKGDPLIGNFDYDEPVKKSTPKPKKTNVFKRVTAATSGKKVTNSKGIGNQFRGAENKAAKDARIKADRAASGMGGGKPPKPPRNVTFSAADFPDDNSRKIVKKVTGSRNVNPTGGTRTPRTVTKQTRALMSGQQKFAKSVVGKGIKKNLPTVYKGLKALKPAGRAFAKTGVIGGLATIGLAASPAVRGFLKKAAAGGIAGGILGGAAASQKESDKERIKKMKKPVFKDEILDKKGKQKFPDSKKVVTTGLNLSDISKPKKKDKSRTAQSIKTETDYLKQRQKVAPYGAKYSG